MPIEVRELVIKATVAPEGGAAPAAATGSLSVDNVSANEELIKICVDKVLEILNDRDGR